MKAGFLICGALTYLGVLSGQGHLLAQNSAKYHTEDSTLFEWLKEVASYKNFNEQIEMKITDSLRKVCAKRGVVELQLGKRTFSCGAQITTDTIYERKLPTQ